MFDTFTPDRYNRVLRTLGYCLTLDPVAEVWHGLTVVLAARLSLEERTVLAWGVLRSLPPDAVQDVSHAVLPEHTSPPIPPLFEYMDEASFWADMAEPEALEAYCLASFNRMDASRRAAFLDYVRGRRVA